MGNGAVVAIDTHAYIKKLVNAGFTEKQAEVQTDTINSAFKNFSDKQRHDLATKADIADVKADVADLKADIADIKAEIKTIKWIGSFIIGLVAAIFMILLKLSLNF